MGDEPPVWLVIQVWLIEVLHQWQNGGETPLYLGVLPTSAMDVSCDAWIRDHLDDLVAVPLPPPTLRPWLRARGESAVLWAQSLESAGETPPTGPRATIYEIFLIEEWHDHLRARWPGVGRNLH
jgi:hypothetical protein